LTDDRYRSLRLIKRSQTAEVFEATALGPEGFRRRVVLKRLLPEAAQDDGLKQAFLDEARLGAQLSHPGLVPVFDFGLVDHAPFLIGEYVDGASLTQLLDLLRERGDFVPVDLAAHIALELCRTLSFMHAARDLKGRELRLVHRDLSPNNVLISWDGSVRIIDLGVASSTERRQKSRVGWTKGTEGFMSPEQALGKPVTAGSDLYGLGCLIHFMLTGASPVENRADQLRIAAGGAINLSTSIDRGMAEVLRRALAFEPQRRFPSAESMAAPLWALLRARADSEPVSALKAWLEPIKPEETVTKLGGVAGLFDLQLLGPLVPDDESSELRHFTAVGTVPGAELTPAPTKLRGPSQTPSFPDLTRPLPEDEDPPQASVTPILGPGASVLASETLRDQPLSVTRPPAAVTPFSTVGPVQATTPTNPPVVVQIDRPPPIGGRLGLAALFVSVTLLVAVFIARREPEQVAAVPIPPTQTTPPPAAAPTPVRVEPNVPVVEAQPRLPEVPEETPPEPRPRAPRPSPRPPPARRSVLPALADRGLEPSDLLSDPVTAAAWQQYTEAKAQKDEARLRSAEEQVLSTTNQLVIDEGLLRRKLDRAARRLENRVATGDEGTELERRFLDLRVALTKVRSSDEREALAKEIYSFSRRLD
jgi:serine/threonine protein kinase